MAKCQQSVKICSTYHLDMKWTPEEGNQINKLYKYFVVSKQVWNLFHFMGTHRGSFTLLQILVSVQSFIIDLHIFGIRQCFVDFFVFLIYFCSFFKKFVSGQTFSLVFVAFSPTVQCHEITSIHELCIEWFCVMVANS